MRKMAGHDRTRWAKERRAWCAEEDRTGQAVRRYLSEEDFATDLEQRAAAGWKVRSKSSRELTFRVQDETVTRQLITVTYFR